VRVRPKNIAGSGTPMLWWTLTARTWSDWLPVHVFVIEHERGTVLFDTGQSRDSVTEPDYYPRGPLGWVYRRQAAFRVEPEDELVTQLAEIGHPVSSLSLAVISHLHQDHVGNVAALAGTPVLVSAAELALLEERTPELHGVLPAHVRAPGVAFTPVHVAPTDDPLLAPFGAAHDIHGDGSLLLVPTPGHSPGSMSLLIRRGDAPPLLLVGDVTYDYTLLPRGIVPDVGDRPTQLETARRIVALQSLLPDLRVLAAHDPATLTTLTAPH
jgi:glyoxylase-like metal-dependent hydrolase (beta-lactamase superfamily II)